MENKKPMTPEQLHTELDLCSQLVSEMLQKNYSDNMHDLYHQMTQLMETLEDMFAHVEYEVEGVEDEKVS